MVLKPPIHFKERRLVRKSRNWQNSLETLAGTRYRPVLEPLTGR